jgi:hypothetical protein
MGVTAAAGMVRRFEEAVRDHEMIGAQHLEDRLVINATYKRTKQALIKALTTVKGQ